MIKIGDLVCIYMGRSRYHLGIVSNIYNNSDNIESYDIHWINGQYTLKLSRGTILPWIANVQDILQDRLAYASILSS